MTDLVLLTPGPANTSERVRAAMARGDLCHREPEFGTLLNDIRAGLVETLGLADSHEAVVITGSGTAAVEMSLLSAVRPGRAVLVLDNGSYGARIHRMCEVYGLPVHRIRAEWHRPIDPAEVAAALAAHPEIDAVAGVMHETSSGLVNPVAEIGALVAPTDAVFVVDAISATGHEEPGLPGIGADFICGTANKGLHGLPGASFTFVSNDKGMRRLRAVPPRGLYLDLAGHLDAQRAGDPLYTAAVPAYYALDEAIREFRDQGGYPARLADYRARAAALRDGLHRLGLELPIAPEHRSNSVTLVRLPADVSYLWLHDSLKERGFVVYAAQGALSTEFFRVCNMGHLSVDRLELFVSTLADVLSPAGRR